MRARYAVSFVSASPHLYFDSVPVVLSALKCYIGSRYNDNSMVLSNNSTQLNSKVFISRNIQHRSIATWDWNPHWFICPITTEFKKFNLVTSVLNHNWLVHVHTQKHTQKHCAWQICQEKNRSFHTCDWKHRKKYKNVFLAGTVLASLTHWGRDKMAAFSQTTISNAFSSIKMFEFRLQFFCS